MPDKQDFSKPLAVSVRTACELIDVGNTSMWQLISSGRVQTTTIGRKRLVIYASLEKLLESGPAPGPRRGRPRKFPAPSAAGGAEPRPEQGSESSNCVQGRGAGSFRLGPRYVAPSSGRVGGHRD